MMRRKLTNPATPKVISDVRSISKPRKSNTPFRRLDANSTERNDKMNTKSNIQTTEPQIDTSTIAPQ